MRKVNFALLLLALSGCTASPPSVKDVAILSTPPVLDKITFHTVQERYLVVYPEFRFHSADGNVVAIHRDMLSSTSPTALNFMSDSRIDISPEQQKKGAVFVGGFHCGPEQYQVQVRAYLIDSNHNHSNSLDYTIDCSKALPEPGKS